MIQGCGTQPGGAPMVLLGLNAAEMTQLLAGTTAITVDVEAINPLMPPMQIVLVGGDDAAVADRIRDRWPGVWELPRG